MKSGQTCPTCRHATVREWEEEQLPITADGKKYTTVLRMCERYECHFFETTIS